jgi:hypothetical protein
MKNLSNMLTGLKQKKTITKKICLLSGTASILLAAAAASSLSSSTVATGRAEMASLIFPTAFENYKNKKQEHGSRISIPRVIRIGLWQHI